MPDDTTLTRSRLSRPQKNKQRTLLFSIVLVGIVLFLVLKIVPTLLTLGSVGAQAILNKNISLKKTDDHVNILLLGIGGGTHEGPNLSDTIIFASIDPKAKKVTLVSIPRDLWVPDLDAKINSAYSTGQDRETGGGLKLAKAIVTKILNQPVDYAVRIDFDGFVKAVDMLGGLDIVVDRILDDYAYPITGKEDETCDLTDEEIVDLTAQIATNSATESEAFPCRYEHLHFDLGQTHMDGITALKFVRSRHALGLEGSDFARSKRQEKVIQAFKDKLFSLNTVLNPVKILNLIDVIKDSIDTDIKQEEYDDFIKLAQKMNDAAIDSAVLDFGDPSVGREGLLINPPLSTDYRGQWVIIPAAGSDNYSQIHAFVACEVKGVGCPTPTPTRIPKQR
ncbi:MAG: LCP family protein [bacterium]|nr:LCP family protein [bacterium]